MCMLPYLMHAVSSIDMEAFGLIGYVAKNHLTVCPVCVRCFHSQVLDKTVDIFTDMSAAASSRRGMVIGFNGA